MIPDHDVIIQAKVRRVLESDSACSVGLEGMCGHVQAHPILVFISSLCSIWRAVVSSCAFEATATPPTWYVLAKQVGLDETGLGW